MSSLKNSATVKEERRDPTFFLPEEEMSYEIKKKKKKKKKKQEDPFKDIEEKIREPALTALDPDIGAALDPEVTIKVENIEVELDINDFSHMDDEFQDNNENSQPEPIVKFEEQNKEAVLLTFESVISDKILYGEPIESIENEFDQEQDEPPELAMSFLCKICHLVFKTQKTLVQHQKRMHKRFRRSFKHKCEHCGMQYEFKNSLEAHKKRRHSPNSVIDDMKERTCDICALVFKGVNRLRMHMRRTHGSFEDAFKHVCQDCGLTYDKTQSLLVHRKRKHPTVKKPKVTQWFNCLFCPKVFTRRETYTRHVQRKHKVDDDNVGTKGPKIKTEKSEIGETTCMYCSLVFSSVSYLNWHLRRKHNVKIEDYKLKCKICNLSYNKVESLKRHIKRKHTQDNYCSVCCKQFTSKASYINHTHVRQVQECNICGQIFAHQGGLAKHLRCTHKIESPATVFCHICNKGFYSKKYLKSHMIKVHLKITYHCKLCDKNFKAKESYRRHMIVKHPNDNDLEVGPLHMCEKCPEGFRNEFELAKHINLVHNEPEIEIKKEEDDSIKTSFKCTKCTDDFNTWEQLRAHFDESHRMTEEVQCQICGDMMSRSDLQKHIKIHDEIEVQCKYCEFKTKNKVSMTQHLLRHKNSETLNCDYPLCRYKTFYEDAMLKHKKRHEASAKLQCASCPFQTMNKYILRYHEEAHATGKKRYSCDQCDYATILPANLVQHKYKHSSEKRFKCEVCPFATKYNTSLRFHVRKKHCDLPTFR